MRLETIDRTGFAPRPQARAHGRGAAAIAQFITSLALVVSIAVVVTAVTIGIARAEALAAAADDPHARLAAAILFAVVLVGMVGSTALFSQTHAKLE